MDSSVANLPAWFALKQREYLRRVLFSITRHKTINGRTKLTIQLSRVCEDTEELYRKSSFYLPMFLIPRCREKKREGEPAGLNRKPVRNHPVVEAGTINF
jgi:hypothetical protein